MIEGIDKLSSLPRGTGALGFYKDAKQYVPIASVRLASQMPGGERPAFEYLDTGSATFADYLRVRANRMRRFLHPPGGRRRPVQRPGAGAPEADRRARLERR